VRKTLFAVVFNGYKKTVTDGKLIFLSEKCAHNRWPLIRVWGTLLPQLAGWVDISGLGKDWEGDYL